MDNATTVALIDGVVKPDTNVSVPSLGPTSADGSLNLPNTNTSSFATATPTPSANTTASPIGTEEPLNATVSTTPIPSLAPVADTSTTTSPISTDAIIFKTTVPSLVPIFLGNGTNQLPVNTPTNDPVIQVPDSPLGIANQPPTNTSTPVSLLDQANLNSTSHALGPLSTGSALDQVLAGNAQLPDDPAAVRALIVESYNSTEDPVCGLGYICQENERVKCTDLQAIHRLQGFGNIHAGLWCPDGTDVYTNCPIGSYCPDPMTKVLCTEGMFCPHKTEKPAIRCRTCKEGAEKLRAVPGGIALLVLMGVAALCFILYRIVRKYREEQLARWMALVERRVDSIRIDALQLGKQDELESIKPHLDLIAKRLTSHKGGTNSGISAMSPVSAHPNSGKAVFNARRLFDELDSNGDGFLSYEEANTILQLDEVQLQEFVRRMNTLGGVDRGLVTVSRAVFCRYFVKVLAQTSHFRPTSDEAADLFDQIAETFGTTKNGDIESAPFFHTPLLSFLTDSQINDLLVRLRGCQAERPGFFGTSMIGDSLIGSTHGAHHSFGIEQSVVSAAAQRFRTGRPERAIQRETFVANYPHLLIQVVTDPVDLPAVSERFEEQEEGVDITFDNLSLAVNVGDKKINVVDGVTGRLRGGTMTALMGGSGAGKSSLLNALCGRAFYGETGGTIWINGKKSSIEEHSHCIGFVPQDDIVYAELTVRENFIYSGRFQLPKGTPLQDIHDLADATLANLGLSRVANSLVGDVHRRGVSGGEKKRVNIGLELMSNPRALFLDEPTSGLDSSSALLVMQSLRALVENQGVTVCCVIHQPRKVIFELFDDLILLGAGGKVVYNGPVCEAQEYIEGLKYRFPAGDSVADWLIDVSAGQAEPVEDTDDSHNTTKQSEMSMIGSTFAHNAGVSSNDVEENQEQAKLRREKLYTEWESYFCSDAMTEEEQERYQPPMAFKFPAVTERPSFLTQLLVQIQRNVLVSRRNSTSKLIDTMMIVGAVVLGSAFEGVVEVTVGGDPPGVSFEALVSGNAEDLFGQLGFLFQYALGSNPQLLSYGLKTDVLVGVLVGLTAAKAITDKRTEFSREAASGYDVNAYFLAANITSTIKHSLQTLVAAAASYWIRDSLFDWGAYFATFLMLSWLCVSWALLLPLLVAPKNVVLAVAFFMAFFGLLCSGGLSPVRYLKIYGDGNSALALFSGFISPNRYFIEGLTVSELRCLPEQSGFTVSPESPALTESFSFAATSLGQNDLGVGEYSCSGWYWGILPALLVGLTVRVLAAGVIHVSGRSMQARRPLLEELRREKAKFSSWHDMLKSVRFAVAMFVVTFIVLFSMAAWAILRKVGDSS